MSKKRRELSTDEKKLWRRVASTVKPRRKILEEDAPDPVVESASPKRRATIAPPKAPTSKPIAKPVAPIADRGAEKNVRRGKVEIGATLDLHGYTQDSAYTALATFLSSAQRRGVRTALVITGAGRLGEGILRRRLPDWLSLGELKPLVAGYAQAHRAHGGAGAFYVFLKRSTSKA